MKRLIFKKPFNGLGKALELIPESYKVDGKEFQMTDNTESYSIRWEGSLNEGSAIVTQGFDKTLVNEDINKMKKLMGYKSLDTLGALKGTERLDENKAFEDVFNKSKKLLAENKIEEGKILIKESKEVEKIEETDEVEDLETEEDLADAHWDRMFKGKGGKPEKTEE